MSSSPGRRGPSSEVKNSPAAFSFTSARSSSSNTVSRLARRRRFFPRLPASAPEPASSPPSESESESSESSLELSRSSEPSEPSDSAPAFRAPPTSAAPSVLSTKPSSSYESTLAPSSSPPLAALPPPPSLSSASSTTYLWRAFLLTPGCKSGSPPPGRLAPPTEAMPGRLLSCAPPGRGWLTAGAWGYCSRAGPGGREVLCRAGVLAATPQSPPAATTDMHLRCARPLPCWRETSLPARAWPRDWSRSTPWQRSGPRLQAPLRGRLAAPSEHWKARPASETPPRNARPALPVQAPQRSPDPFPPSQPQQPPQAVL